jgi:hypothetical protein
MSQREVTERDLRMPEFRDAKVEDLEFRRDGKIVRKDRWETGMHRIASALGFSSREGFEIDDVVAAVESRAWALPAGWAAHIQNVEGSRNRKLVLTHTVSGVVSMGEFVPQGPVAAEMLASLAGDLE